MKKLIITAAVVLTASFSFFSYQSKAVSSNTTKETTIKLTAADQADFNPVKNVKMDVGSADIK